jgi:glycosyltransferase involved in cell wall biosynthesis
MNIGRLNNKERLRNIARSIRYCNWVLNYRKQCLSAVDHIIAVCDFIKAKYLIFGVDRPITVIKNRVDESKIAFKPIRRVHLPLQLGAMGVFRLRKDGDLLVKALSLLEDKRNDFILHVWSSVDDGYRKIYDHLVKIFNVVDHGPYSPDDINNIFEKIDLLIYPSSSADTYPLSLLEALASRTPIIVARSHGMSEIVRDGENGLSFEPLNVVSLANSIALFLKNPKMIEMMQEKIDPPAPYDDLVKENMKIYESLVSRK